MNKIQMIGPEALGIVYDKDQGAKRRIKKKLSSIHFFNRYSTFESSLPIPCLDFISIVYPK